MKNRAAKLITAALTAALITTGMTAQTASAEPYEVYNYDSRGSAVPSQAGYTPEKAVTGDDLGIGHFNAPTDIFRDSNNSFYIADSGNNRIVSVNADMDSVTAVYDSFTMPDGSKTTLNEPLSVYVSPETGYLYIADSKNSRVLVTEGENVVKEITKPVSELYDSSKTFFPQRVIADKAGNVYVVLSNITTGAAMFSPDGTFTGFYGANRVEATAEIVSNYIRNMFMSEEKRARRTRSIPSGITSFDISGDFIFTCSASDTQDTDTVKKLNSAGNNIFADRELTFGDYIPMYDTAANKTYSTAICDIDIGDDGTINCLDLTAGRIFQYDEDCNLLFIMGTNAKQLGGFDCASAIESSEDRLYVADSRKNSITVFRETSFGSIVHEASVLYSEGKYEEALEPWYEVLRRDGSYRRAYVGAASALLNSGDYKGAMKYAKLANEQDIYNNAFEGYRLEFLRKNFAAVTAVIAAAVILASVLAVRGRKRRRERLAAEEAEKLRRRYSAGEEEEKS